MFFSLRGHVFEKKMFFLRQFLGKFFRIFSKFFQNFFFFPFIANFALITMVTRKKYGNDCFPVKNGFYTLKTVYFTPNGSKRGFLAKYSYQ